MKKRAILAPRNDTVERGNDDLLEEIPGETTEYFAVDSTVEQHDAVQYPIEFLNSLSPSGLPKHNIKLRVGCPIMLLRNLDPPMLVNGTRLVVKNLYRNLIEATIVTGHWAKKSVYIPRIPLIPSAYPFEFRRLQFPIRVSFAMTINKAQGQTLHTAGLYLNPGCFSHGQFYVAASRVGNPRNLYFLTSKNRKTKNIVYKKALE